LTAAIYTSRYALSTLVIAKDTGGTANLAPEVENWPGFIGTGMELMNKIAEQSSRFGAELLNEDILSVEKKEDLFYVKTKNSEFSSKSLIVSLGTEHRKMNIKGEEEFLGKGVSFCATCDGNFFRNKIVAVIGGANSAANAALYLSKIAKKVFILYRKHEMSCEPISLEKLKKMDNVEIIYFTKPLEITGTKRVEKMKVLVEEPEKEKKEIELVLDGVFVEIGANPTTEVLQKLNLKQDCDNYIETDKEMKTSMEGVFAAGDLTNNNFKQMITAAGEGAVAAKSVYDFLIKK
jgi:thioredoxin reductase (NADPH)